MLKTCARTVVAILLAGLAATAVAAEPWVTTWTASPQPSWPSSFPLPTNTPSGLSDETVRQVVRTSVGGDRVRVVLSNAYGRRPLTIASVHVAKSGGKLAIEPASDRALRFGGKASVTIAPGRTATSDPVDLAVAPLSPLAISLHLKEESPTTTFHWDGRQTAGIARGDQVAATDLEPTTTITSRVFLAAVQVENRDVQGTVVALGDSITDGATATIDADTRWPDVLANRLAPRGIAVLNAGISGARLLSDGMGVNALARFDRDVLAQPKVKAVIVLIGINDIAWPGTAFALTEKRPTFEALTAGYRRLVDAAHAKGVRVIGATLTPFSAALPGTPLDNYYQAEKDALRQRLNDWIRSSGTFDAVVDFDAVLRDPAHPSQFARAYDSGDHLHPSDTGNRAMADAIDLDALLTSTKNTKGKP